MLQLSDDLIKREIRGEPKKSLVLKKHVQLCLPVAEHDIMTIITAIFVK